MVRRLFVTWFVLLASITVAHANGRAPGTSTINFKQGDPQHVAAGMTFGMVMSADGGTTWHWICEGAVRYGGMYDPDYAYTATGALFATTFDGSLVNRSGCAFDPTSQAAKFFSSITLGPDNALYMAAAHTANPLIGDPGDARIFRSTDDGVTFPTPAASPGQVGDWWNSIEVAPSNAQRIYLSGYRLTGGLRTFLLFRSDDAAATFQPMSMTGLVTSKNSTIDIVGIAAGDPDKVFVRISYQAENQVGDGLFRSDDGGASWTPILAKSDELAFVIRANGDLVAGGRNVGVSVSRAPSYGAAWEELTGAPHVNCLVESAGAVWACTQNYGANQVPSDDAGIMKSTDLVTWTKVLRFQDIQGPVDCAAGTLQHDVCVAASPSPWCGLKAQLGIVADPTTCPAAGGDMVPGDVTTVTPPKSCCQAGDGASGVATLLVVGLGLAWSRRRRRR